MVSIPIGFSGSLQRWHSGPSKDLARCVSIPIGFSGSLQLPERRAISQQLAVSIPIGFSGSLQLCSFPLSERFLISFNPYRVFRFAATYTPASPLKVTKLVFQSLSGFQVRCNTIMKKGHGLTLREFQSLSGFQVRCNDGPIA